MIENIQFLQCAMTGVMILFVLFLVIFILGVMEGKR